MIGNKNHNSLILTVTVVDEKMFLLTLSQEKDNFQKTL